MNLSCFNRLWGGIIIWDNRPRHFSFKCNDFFEAIASSLSRHIERVCVQKYLSCPFSISWPENTIQDNSFESEVVHRSNSIEQDSTMQKNQVINAIIEYLEEIAKQLLPIFFAGKF